MVIRYMLDTDACIALIKNSAGIDAKPVVPSDSGGSRDIQYCCC